MLEISVCTVICFYRSSLCMTDLIKIYAERQIAYGLELNKILFEMSFDTKETATPVWHSSHKICRWLFVKISYLIFVIYKNLC
jgi:hypothetical protein